MMKHNDDRIRKSRWPALVVGFLIVAGLVAKCDTIYREIPVDARELSNADVRIFQKTPIWTLAKAVKDNDTLTLAELLSRRDMDVNYREGVHGMTLLSFALDNGRKAAFRILLERGADPDLQCRRNGSRPVEEAANRTDDDTYYLELLLKYRASLELPFGFYQDDGTWFQLPLLQYAMSVNRRRTTRLLLDQGVDVTGVDGNGKTTLAVAIDRRLFDVALELLNRGAEYRSPASGRGDQAWDNLTPVEMLRWDLYQLGSPEHESKMAVVRWLRERGVDYDTVPIPSVTRMRIYEDYPDSVEIYLKNY